jgi:hypothetical protein
LHQKELHSWVQATNEGLSWLQKKFTSFLYKKNSRGNLHVSKVIKLHDILLLKITST